MTAPAPKIELGSKKRCLLSGFRCRWCKYYLIPDKSLFDSRSVSKLAFSPSFFLPLWVQWLSTDCSWRSRGSCTARVQSWAPTVVRSGPSSSSMERSARTTSGGRRDDTDSTLKTSTGPEVSLWRTTNEKRTCRHCELIERAYKYFFYVSHFDQASVYFRDVTWWTSGAFLWIIECFFQLFRHNINFFFYRNGKTLKHFK